MMTTNGVDQLKEAILSKDIDQVNEKLSNLYKEIPSNDLLMQIITTPAVITELHVMMVENLGVNQRLMRLNARVAHRRKRALLFVQAMMNGVKYLK